MTHQSNTHLVVSGYTVRVLRESDRPALVDHLLRLSPEDRRLRFGMGLGDYQLEKLARSFQLEGLTYGAFDDAGKLLATVMVLFPCKDSKAGELAITLDRPARGKGLGKYLVHLALSHAANAGVTSVEIIFQSSNMPMARICASLPGPFQVDGAERFKYVAMNLYKSLFGGNMLETET